jgi:hypothetical protein
MEHTKAFIVKKPFLRRSCTLEINKLYNPIARNKARKFSVIILLFDSYEQYLNNKVE